MGQVTGISWTDHTFNPWIGCSKVHAGCMHCYAERDFDTRRGVAKWGIAGTRVKTSDDNWRKPLKWNRDAEAAGERRRVFCASLADVFESWGGGRVYDHNGQLLLKSYLGDARDTFDEIPDKWDQCTDKQGWQPLELDDLRGDLFKLIDSTPHLDWLLLTKRPENVLKMWPRRGDYQYVAEAAEMNEFPMYRRDNVWLGTSVSDQATADEFVPRLLGCRDLCPVLFLSAEPLLDRINFRWAKWQSFSEQPGGVTDELDGLRRLDWIIAGGESGGHFRQMMTEDVRLLRDQCVSAGVPFFFKQWSGANPKVLGKELDGREWCEFPTSVVGV